jgi:hypothetical protein
MRRHSRVDLYAKTVALAGLGCLGVGGAILDYRSDALHFPVVGPAAEFAPPAGTPSVLTLVDVPGFNSTESIGWTLAVPAPAPQPKVAETRTRPVEPTTYVAEPLSSPRVTRPALQIASLSAEVAAPDLPIGAVALAPAPLATVAFDTGALPLPTTLMVLSQGDDAQDGFLSGVLHKTSSSVSTSFGKAGNSLVGAFRVVRGAVRKAARF